MVKDKIFYSFEEKSELKTLQKTVNISIMKNSFNLSTFDTNRRVLALAKIESVRQQQSEIMTV